MWITPFLITLAWFSTTQANDYCENLLTECRQIIPWTRCYEDRIATCTIRKRFMPNFFRQRVNSSQEAKVRPTLEHKVHIPSSALQRSRGAALEEEVLLVATLINSTYFEGLPQGRATVGGIVPNQSAPKQYTVMGALVLAVMAGSQPVRNLSQPIKLTFKHNNRGENGTCVFWQESELEDGIGYWSTGGCDTIDSGTEFICSCNHLSFFAVLVNPVISVDAPNYLILTYINCIGSALSIFFAIISLILYICLQRRRPEKAISVHIQLTVALLCLHISYLLSTFWVRQLNENQEGFFCWFLGLFLHWSMLATFSWTALEGFHLYLLLVRVFNIYVRRYLLKLSLVGWGLPTLIAGACGISGVYGKHSLELKDAENSTASNAVAQCWMSSHPVSYVTTMALPCLVILCNSCMLGLVVFKLQGIRGGSRGTESISDWKKMNREKGTRLWKDCATVLGLSCVLGLPWGLMSTTYISLPGIYVFTILNSLQGVFMFLWSVALTCKSRSECSSSIGGPCSQKMMTTSFNN
ncbi:adhesion G-protein coupled receptor G1-like isoform X2 [Xiphias gladius]|uniref:adhesion G-protein coupled receptor G1-like isoform X2 n=1 Tax=Xiphias gladius TaxID=8245 RepID=UPI001A99E96B|nr:adhesion G-protein coupled receptor G1-like isoform X2 [Xiphias gladius]